MIILVHDRKDNLHLVDYTSPSGNKFTICGLMYSKKDIITTLALDNTIHNICRTCYEDYETMYLDDLNIDLRFAKSASYRNIRTTYQRVKDTPPEIEHWGLNEKHWQKLIRFQRKTQRK